MVKGIVRIYWLMSFLFSFGISLAAGATYVLFLMSHDLNIFEAQLVNVACFLTLAIFEIPTGAIADAFGRKLSFVASCFVASASSFFYWLSKDFTGFAIAEMIFAIAGTLKSGAFQAWVVDELDHHGFSGSLNKVFSREQQLSTLAMMTGSVIGGFIGKSSLSFPWFIGAVVFFVTGFLAIFLMKEKSFARQKFSFKSGYETSFALAKEGIKFAKNNSAIGFVFLAGTFQFFALQAPNMQWQPFFIKFFKDTSGLGFVKIGISLSLIFGSQLAIPLLRKLRNEKLALNLSQAMIGVGLALSALFRIFPAVILAFLFHEMGRGMFNPIKDAFLNQHIDSKHRATLISIESISHHFGGAIGLAVSGLIALKASVSVSWLVSGLALIVLGGLVWLTNGKK